MGTHEPAYDACIDVFYAIEKLVIVSSAKSISIASTLHQRYKTFLHTTVGEDDMKGMELVLKKIQFKQQQNLNKAKSATAAAVASRSCNFPSCTNSTTDLKSCSRYVLSFSYLYIYTLIHTFMHIFSVCNYDFLSFFLSFVRFLSYTYSTFHKLHPMFHIRCSIVFYCCREHQVADWKTHKAACKKRNVVTPTPSINDMDQSPRLPVVENLNLQIRCSMIPCFFT